MNAAAVEIYNAQSKDKRLFTVEEIDALLRAWFDGHPDVRDHVRELSDKDVQEFNNYYHQMRLHRLNESILMCILAGDYVVTGIDEDGEEILEERGVLEGEG